VAPGFRPAIATTRIRYRFDPAEGRMYRQAGSAPERALHGKFESVVFFYVPQGGRTRLDVQITCSSYDPRRGRPNVLTLGASFGASMQVLRSRYGMWRASPMNVVNNINGIGNCARTDVYNLKYPDLLDVQTAVARKIVEELREFDNLYYEVCNEPYFGGVTMEWQHRIIDAIVTAEKDFPDKHLISLNIANGRKKVEKPHPAVSIFNFHYCVPPDTVAMNYGLNKVIGENETGFRGRADVLYRTEGWDFMLAGGGLFNNLDYSFTPKHPDGTFLDYRSPGGGSPTLRRQLRILNL